MTKRVLITGSPDRVERLTKVFADAGVESVALGDPGAVDYYVQLGVTVPARGDTIVHRVHSFLSDGLLDRFTVAEQVLPMLEDGAVVLLVAGNVPAEVAAPDDRAARLSLLTVLAHAMRADLAPKRVLIRVITSDQGDSEIARYALTGSKDPQAPVSSGSSAADEAERSYEDWRNQVLGLAHIEF